MEEKISFIPKKTLNPEPRGRKSGLGFFMALSFLVFFASIGLFGGLILYKNYLNEYNEGLNSDLNKQKNSFETDSVKEVMNLSQKINLAERLVESHKAPSSVFDFLSNYTLAEIRFTDFNYSNSIPEKESDGEETVVSMSGLAKNYSDIELQNEAFKSSSLVKSISFSDFNLNNKGEVSFSMKIGFDPSVINYRVETE